MTRRILLAIAMLAASACAGGAAAFFTAQADIPDNVITAGTVSVSAEPTSAALSVQALAPGETQWRSVTIVNDGTLPMDAVVTAAKKAGFTDLYSALSCRVVDEGGAVLYEGALASMRTTAVPLPPGARRQLEFGVGLPAETGNDLMGDYVKLTVYVDAEQAR